MTIFFVHMPKCGGKSLREGLKEAYGDELLLDYANPATKRFSARLQSFYAYWKHFPVTKRYQFVYGHYSFDRYKKYLGRNDVKLGMFFRDPVDLICSYYFYLTTKYPERHYGDLLTFTRQEPYMSIYKVYLGSVSVDELDFIGIVEDYSRSLDLFEMVFRKRIKEYQINITKPKPRNYREYLRREGTLDAVENLMGMNMKRYHEALARYEKLCTKYNIQQTESE